MHAIVCNTWNLLLRQHGVQIHAQRGKHRHCRAYRKTWCAKETRLTAQNGPRGINNRGTRATSPQHRSIVTGKSGWGKEFLGDPLIVHFIMVILVCFSFICISMFSPEWDNFLCTNFREVYLMKYRGITHRFSLKDLWTHTRELFYHSGDCGKTDHWFSILGPQTY